jgi:hypothetical protein
VEATVKLCKVLAVAVVAMVSSWLVVQTHAGDTKKDETYVRVEVKGKLQTGIMAPGGETTGVIVQTETMTLELDLSKHKELKAAADKLKDQVVIATGILTMHKGVAVKTRLIVHVTDLKAAEKK